MGFASMSRRLMNQISGRSEWETKLGTGSSSEEPLSAVCPHMPFLSRVPFGVFVDHNNRSMTPNCRIFSTS